MARPRINDGIGTVFGGVLGAMAGGPAGAAVGGFLGTALTNQAMSLDASLRHACEEHGLKLAYWERQSKVAILVAVQDERGGYWPVTASVTPREGMTPDELADELYDAFLKSLKKWQRTHGAPRAS